VPPASEAKRISQETIEDLKWADHAKNNFSLEMSCKKHASFWERTIHQDLGGIQVK
jgi:hypothetical protein